MLLRGKLRLIGATLNYEVGPKTRVRPFLMITTCFTAHTVTMFSLKVERVAGDYLERVPKKRYNPILLVRSAPLPFLASTIYISHFPYSILLYCTI